MKTIVFDFDDTLTAYDTIFPFLYFANDNTKAVKQMKKGICWVLRVAYRLKLLSNLYLKNWAVKLFISNYSKDQIQKRAKEFFEQLDFHEKVYALFQNYCRDGNAQVYLSTASFSDYVEFLKQTFPNLIIQASSLNYEDGKVKGVKFNNYGNCKATPWANSAIDVLFTDSLSDLPLVEKAKQIQFVTAKGEIQACNSSNEFVQCCKRC